ncbi:MAG: hypothetical protein V3V30_02555 [Parvularculaceae bacterium]
MPREISLCSVKPYSGLGATDKPNMGKPPDDHFASDGESQPGNLEQKIR